MNFIDITPFVIPERVLNFDFSTQMLFRCIERKYAETFINGEIRFGQPKNWIEKEKNGKGQTAAKAIKLPNGVDITAKLNAYNSGFYKKEAPIIIYDVSLRANNDYEQTGTH